ncbi:MAG: rhodanese-like domain-containing protein [Gemmataceae bacterium]
MSYEISPQALKAKLDAGEPVFLVDVREPEEYAICRLPGGVLIPMGEVVGRLEEIQSAEAPVVVYCHHGIRSLRAVGFLRANGLSDAVSLAGGIEAWSTRVDPTVPRY